MTPAGNRVGELRETGKPVTLKVRAARDEQDAFSEAAKLTGLSLSAWLRFVCRRCDSAAKGGWQTGALALGNARCPRVGLFLPPEN